MVEILIVEDDPNIARTIEVTISLVGYECRICGDGAAAVQEVLEHDYDLVLLDVMLPGMDGFEVIQKIQSKGTPVIFLTALQDVTDKVKGLRLGAEDYIVKPFEASAQYGCSVCQTHPLLPARFPHPPLQYLPLYTSYVFSLPEPPHCLSTKNTCLSTAMLLIINDFVSLFNQKTHTVYNNLL